MPIREMPAFVFSHKHVRNAVIYALASSFMLIVQLILMKSNPIALIFNIIIPFTAAITFGCHAITMAMDRPTMLLDSTIVYFVSLLVNQLISVEVGVEETYPVFTFLELVPFVFFSIAVVTDKIKKPARRILEIACVIILVSCLAIALLAIFFNMKLFSERLSQRVLHVSGHGRAADHLRHTAPGADPPQGQDEGEGERGVSVPP